MAVTVKIPTQLRAATGGEAETQVEGATVGGGARRRCTRATTSCASASADDDGELRRFVNVYVGGEDIRFLDGLATRGRGRRRGDDPARRRRRLS